LKPSDSGLKSLKISFYDERKKKIQTVFTLTMCYNFFSNLSKTYKLYFYFSFFIIIFLLNAKNILSNEFILTMEARKGHANTVKPVLRGHLLSKCKGHCYNNLFLQPSTNYDILQNTL
jgi:hypothetical protein